MVVGVVFVFVVCIGSVLDGSIELGVVKIVGTIGVLTEFSIVVVSFGIQIIFGTSLLLIACA